MDFKKGLQIAASLALVVSCGLLGYGITAFASDFSTAKAIRLVKISAKRYEFVPNNISLKIGETIDVEIVTEDVLMGFNAPDFGTRANILPGQTTHVKLTASKLGTFSFICDVFCGSGHEEMSGTITVTE